MKQKRKILLCALSFIAVALFSCGIAFLPLDAFSPSNENQEETTEARDFSVTVSMGTMTLSSDFLGYGGNTNADYTYTTETGYRITVQGPRLKLHIHAGRTINTPARNITLTSYQSSYSDNFSESGILNNSKYQICWEIAGNSSYYNYAFDEPSISIDPQGSVTSDHYSCSLPLDHWVTYNTGDNGDSSCSVSWFAPAQSVITRFVIIRDGQQVDTLTRTDYYRELTDHPSYPTYTGYTLQGVYNGTTTSSSKVYNTTERVVSDGGTYYVIYTRNSYYVDVNNYFNGSNDGAVNLGFSFNVRINNVATGGDIQDYYTQQPYQTKFEVYDIRINAGYHLDHYTISVSGIEQSGSSASNIIITTPAQAVTISLYFVPNTYSVRFNPNGGSGSAVTQTGFNYGQSTALRANTFTREYYTFLGWSTSPTATSATFTDGQSVSTLTTTNGGIVDLYAVWVQTSFALTIDPNGGTWNGSTNSQSFIQEDGTSQDIAVPTRYGYNFAGWAISGGDGSLSTFGNIYSRSTDPFFISSNNNVDVYNNAKDGSVTHTLISSTSAGLDDWISGGRVLRVRYTGSCVWGNGLVQSISTSANKVFYTMIYAKVPVGYTLEPAYNASGDGATRTWMTSNQGTGNWQTYVMRWNCGSSGTFSDVGYWYLSGPSASSSNPVDLDIAYLCSFDATGLSVSGVATNSTTYTYGSSNVTLLALWEDTWINHTTPFSGSGTEEDPYIIASAENLAYLSEQVYDGFSKFYNKYFKQTANIDLMQYNWQPIGVEINRSNSNVYCYFGGSYDGNGYTISNLHTPYGTTGAYCYQGLFGLTYTYTDSSSTIKNITMKNVDIRGNAYVGGIVGLWISSTGTIQLDNCSVDGNVYGDVGVGGVVGEASSREIGNIIMSDCLSNASVSASGNSVGGLVGSAKVLSTGSIRIENSVNNGSVISTTSSYVGGVVGSVSSGTTVDACINNGSVSGREFVGGIAGSVAWSGATVRNSTNNGAVTGTLGSIGGIAGMGLSYALIEGNTNYGDVIATGAYYVGGIVGSLSNDSSASSFNYTINKNANYGTVQGKNDVGGIVGSSRANATISNNHNLGNVSTSNSADSAAGISGYFNSGTMTGNTTRGNVTGTRYVGGLVGYLQSGTFNSNQVEGVISGTNNVGGITGYVAAASSFENIGVNARVEMSNLPNSNGLIGQGSNLEITNCYFIGEFVDHSGNAQTMSGFVSAGSTNMVTDSYFIANGRKVMQNTNNFEDWTIIPNLNDGNPIQKELYHLAGIGGDDELLDAWVKTNNILTDSSFEYGDWSAQMGTSGLSTEHARSGQHSWKIIGESSRGETFNRTVTTYEIDSTHIYFVRMYAYQEVHVGEIQAYWKDSDPAVGNATLGTAGQWNMYGWRFDRVGFSGSHPFRIDFDNHNQVGELWVDDVLLIDLTEMYGAGNEPSQEECMRLFA